MRFTIIAVLLLLNINFLIAQKYSNEFLNIGVSARAQAMGGAQAASISDVTAAYWNPAGLASIKTNQISAMHSEWFAGIGAYDYVGIAAPLADQNRSLAFTFIRFGIDNIPNTLSLYESDGTINYDNIVPFSAADYAFMLSYAQPIGNKGLMIGANAKVIRRIIGPFANSWGFGLDAGIQYKVGENLLLGAVVKDFTSTFNAWRFNFTDAEKDVLGITGNDIPINSLELTRPSIVLGAAYNAQFGNFGLLTEANFNVFTDGQRNVLLAVDPLSIDPIIGMELDYKDFVYLRGGVNTIQKELDLTGSEFWSVSPNLGVGLKIRKLHIDYAFTNVGAASDNTYSHVISFLLEIDNSFLKKAFQKQ